jgi:hypothetical protein
MKAENSTTGTQVVDAAERHFSLPKHALFGPGVNFIRYEYTTHKFYRTDSMHGFACL